jgi:NarL family two-component system response regulator YdfI
MKGARGFLLDPRLSSEVEAAVATVLRGQSVLCNEALSLLVAALNGSSAPRGFSLSPCEERVLTCLAVGYSTKEISPALGIQDGTVHRYLNNIYRKLGVHDKTAAVEKYLGMTPIPSLISPK